MRTSIDLLLVGPHSPPVGGVSVHVARVAARATREGLSVAVTSPYAVARQSAVVPYPVIAGRGGKLRRFVACAGVIARQPATVVHFHASALSRLVPLAMLRMLVPAGARTVLTVHSGSWPSQPPISGWRGWIETRLLRRFDIVIAVNNRQAQHLETIRGPTRGVVVIPAFLSDTPGSLRSDVLAILNQARLAGRRVVVLSGYGTPLYRYEDGLAAVRALEPGIACEVIIAVYNTCDARYLARIETLGGGLRLHVVRDLDPGEFLRLLAEAAVYVRATEHDGDSVAVREALDADIPVVASNGAVRPAGVAIYPVGDVDALATALREVLNAPDARRVKVHDRTEDGWRRIYSVYHDLKGSRAISE